MIDEPKELRSIADASAQERLDLIQQAVKLDQIAVMTTTTKVDNKPIYVLVAVTEEGDRQKIWPLAKLFDGDPFDELNPPDGAVVVDKRELQH